MKKRLFLIMILLSAAAANAQNGTKTGAVDADYVVSRLPELAAVESELTSFGASLRQQIQAKYVEYQAKLDGYQEKAAGMTDLDRQSAEQEIRDMQAEITKFEQDAQIELQEKQKNLNWSFILLALGLIIALLLMILRFGI